MNYLVLVSHGGLAEGLRTSLAMFAGDKIDQVLAFGLKEGESTDDFGLRLEQELEILQKSDSVVVLADIVGGSPLTTLASALATRGKLEGTTIMGGMNLTMALTTVVMKDMLSGKALVQTVLAESAEALQEFEIARVADDDDYI